MRFVTLIPFTFWPYLALLLLAYFVFGLGGVAVAAIILVVIR